MSSRAHNSAIVKQSWTSKAWISLGDRPAIVKAWFAATLVALKPVNSSLSWRLKGALPWPTPVIQIGESVYFFATSSDAKNAQAAPSVIKEQSNNRNGYAIMGLLSDFKNSYSSFQSGHSFPLFLAFEIFCSMISLTVFWTWANGFSFPLS